MKLEKWIVALGRGLWRHACRGCIERCGVVAGAAHGGEILSETYFCEEKTV
jgi:hypothetical protein